MSYIVSAKRTAFGTFGGALKKYSATQLAAIAVKGALAAGKVDASVVDHVIIGNVAHTSTDAAYLSRHAALQAGIPITTPALGVNRLCGSGFQAVVSACHEINGKEAEVVVAGGSESMSQAPMSVFGQNIRFNSKLLGQDLQLQDCLWSALTDSHIKTPMGVTAENLAEKYGISRADCDAYAARSQATWGAANASGVFAAEIEPIEVHGKKGPEKFAVDEHPRPSSDLASLGKLPAVFKKGGTVTAGNASGICDGAAALVIASASAVKTHGWTPLTRIVSWGVAGVDPSIMGIGPCPAIRTALKRAGLSLSDISLVEINEAFAAQYLSCEKELGLDREKSNVNGGAIALGHPLGASGARILAHLSHRLVATGGRFAVGAACIGGGQGIAVILENARL